MTQQEIINGNKLIDAFMEANRIASFGKNNNDFSYLNVTVYHESWDWIMPVVQKLYFDDYVTSEQWDEILLSFKRPNIESVWQSVVEFIKWYNLQKSADQK